MPLPSPQGRMFPPSHGQRMSRSSGRWQLRADLSGLPCWPIAKDEARTSRGNGRKADFSFAVIAVIAATDTYWMSALCKIPC